MNTLTTDNPRLRFGFIGFGLIGGAIAKAIRRLYPYAYIHVMNRTVAHVASALSDGTANSIGDVIDDVFGTCDMIFICTPVAQTQQCLKQLVPLVSPDVLITDVGSVKAQICDCARGLGLQKNFIGGHPMAGSERSGYANSSADLLKDHVYVLTPFDETSPEKLTFYKELVESFGCKELTLDPKEHDRAVAGISHLPHLAAAALVHTVMEHDSKNSDMFKLASSGFLDATRIAASSSEMWEQIVRLNPDAISDMLSLYIQSLTDVKHVIDAGQYDKIGQLFDEVRPYREALNKRD